MFNYMMILNVVYFPTYNNKMCFFLAMLAVKSNAYKTLHHESKKKKKKKIQQKKNLYCLINIAKHWPARGV